MSLLLNKTLYNNEVVSYHRIYEFEIDTEMLVVTFKLHSFKDADERASLQPARLINTYSFSWSGSGETLQKEAYDYVKTLPEWKDCTDV